jgi:subtilase family serine protease
MNCRGFRTVLQISASVLALGIPTFAQAPALITQPVDESKLVTLAGNTRPEANAANDLGRVDDKLPLEHMMLQLQHSQQQEEAVNQLIDQLHDPKSANYHHWLTAAEFGQKFGLAQQDLDVISRWLQSHGLAVNAVYASGLLIDFSGSAGQVRDAFHTEIHNLKVDGVPHIANVSDPRIPEALAPAVSGVVSLHDFLPHPMLQRRADYTTTLPGVTGTFYLVTPGDLAVIYDLNPLFKANTVGAGQTIVVVEDTNLYKTQDFTDFRTTFGLSKYTTGKLTTVHPQSPSTNNCTNPGVNGDSFEAAVDVEYATAGAPGATIELASCRDTATFGGLIALVNILNQSSAPPSIVSMSYGECEALSGASTNAAFNSAFQEAVAEGVSVFVSSGDDSAAGCDRDASSATHGIGITGWGETQYNVSVGGTDFGDTFAGSNSTYWNATNTKFFASAKSYIPEIPWNDSCASVLVATFEGFSKTYGSSGFCNSSTGAPFLGTTGGSGGPSGCATGAPSTSGVVSGSCKGYARPSWQTGVVGLPQNNVRNIPDVSLFAANGLWSHFYPVCYSDVAFGGGPCSGAPNTWPGAGGTSFSSPIMAAIQALVNEKNGGAQGNPNVVYYKLAATEYGASGNASCNSTLGNTTSSTCIFYDVTQGDMDVNCTGTHNCFLPSGTQGVLSTSNTAYQPAYGTHTGWDFSTGIGTVNANNLVNQWKSAAP